MKPTLMIVLTGASGFIGRRLAAQLAETQPPASLHCLVGPDERDPFYRAGAQLLISRGIEPRSCDLVSGRGLDGLRGADIVFHLAANTHTWEADHCCNDIGTENLLRAVQLLGPNSHFIFTSTTAVMDSRSDLDEPMIAASKTPQPPLSEYGLSKWRAEEHLRAAAAKQGFRLTIVRLCTVYGPQPRPNTLFDVMKREVSRQSLVSRLNWPALTSFVYVEDVVACLLKAAGDPPQPGQTRVYLLAAESRTLAEVSQLLHLIKELPYRPISLQKAAWRLLSNTRHLCRWGAGRLPAWLFNPVWRLNIVVNPVFNCDSSLMIKDFPDLRPRLLEDCIGDVMSKDWLFKTEMRATLVR